MPIPIEIKLLQKSKTLKIGFDDGMNFDFSCEYLRIFSPSAETRGHDGIRRWVQGKQDVNIIGIEPVGNYAIKLIFDDGHQTGIYSWDNLYELGLNYQNNWEEYLKNKP